MPVQVGMLPSRPCIGVWMDRRERIVWVCIGEALPVVGMERYAKER